MAFLVLNLILSALLLLFANGIARRVRFADALMVFSILFGLLGAFGFPAVFLHGIAIATAAIVWRISHRGPGFLLPLSFGATVAAYGLLVVIATPSEREYAPLRALYPYESMEGRLSATKPIRSGATLEPAAVQRMDRLELRLGNNGNLRQNYQLERLHEQAVELFMNSAGFGSTRMIRVTEAHVTARLRTDPVPAQPGVRFRSEWSPGELERPTASEADPLSRMLDDSVLDFVNLLGFGFVKDRRHVAGFETHRFSQMPTPKNQWKVQNLELVSLLLHDEPEVYISDHLPRMDRLHGQPTRPLDRFERFALEALDQGEDVFITKCDEGAHARCRSEHEALHRMPRR